VAEFWNPTGPGAGLVPDRAGWAAEAADPPAKADAHVGMLGGNHDEHGGDVSASQNGPAAVTSVTTLPGRSPEAPTSAIVSSAVRFCCKSEEFEKVSEGGLEYSSRGFFPRVVKSPAACSSAAKTGEMSPASVPERGPDPAFR